MAVLSLLSSKPLLFDGAMGTELQRRGLTTGTPPDLWNIEHPEIVRQVHLDYVRSGAAVIETNTFGGTKSRLETSGASHSVKEINSSGAEIALQAAGSTAAVVGSMGSLGTLIEPYGEMTKEDAVNQFKEEVEVLVSAGVKSILIETMISLDEALLALEAAHSAGASEIGVTLTFQKTGNEIRTAFGDPIGRCMARLQEAGANFVGSNCGNGFDDMILVASEIRRSTTLPVLVQPNAGMPVIENNIVTYSGSPLGFGEFVKTAMKMGIEMIGGCCGTTPLHIAEARKIVDGTNG